MGKDTARDLKIEWLPISELKPDPRNPKRHSARQIKQIVESIKTFGYLGPLLTDRDNKILAGHDRLLALRLGRPTASCFDKIVTPGGKASEQFVRYAHHLCPQRHHGA